MRANDFITEEVRRPAPDTKAMSQNTDMVKQEIIKKVQSISNIDELNKVHSYVRKVDLGNGFESIFTKDSDLRQVQTILSNAIVEAPGSFEDKLGFAKELVTKNGIINLEELLTPGVKRNLMDIIQTSYVDIFNSVSSVLLNIAGAYSAGATKTNKGKGEFFLAICSPKITLSKGSGDISIAGTPIEVKANLSRIKGRKGYGSTDSAIQAISKNVTAWTKKNIPNAPAPEFKVTLGAKSNFWNGGFNSFCIQNGIEHSAIGKFMKEQLKMLVKSLYLGISNNDLALFTNCINDINGVNFSQIVNVSKKIAFEYYQKSDGFAGVIFVNANTLNFVYVPDSNTFVESIKIKSFGFETGQQNGMQIRI